MTHNQIAFVNDPAHLSEYSILEEHDLGPEGYACIVECRDHEDVNKVNYDTFENYPADLEVELMWRLDQISQDSQYWADMSDVRELHDLRDDKFTGEGVTVAVMDSGIDHSHELFDQRPVHRYDATGSSGIDNVGHGTACAGQIKKVAPDVDLIDVRIFGDNGKGFIKDIVAAYSWLIDNSDKYDVVNMSWGTNNRVRKLEKVQESLIDLGVRDVTSAGNSGGESGTPATSPSSFSVGSCDKDGNMSSFSSYNPDEENPEVSAIGEDVRLARASGTSMGTTLSDSAVVASGTSFSAPNVAGMVARLLSKHEDSTPEELKEAFVSSAEDIEPIEKDGAGIVKYGDAMGNGSAGSDRAKATVWSFSGRDCMFIYADWLKDGEYEVDKQKLLEALEEK